MENYNDNIDYYEIDSPFFVLNKKEMDSIVSFFNGYSTKRSGWCNAYGYQIDLVVLINEVEYNWQFVKFQQSNQDPFYPRNSKSHLHINLDFKIKRTDLKAYLGRNPFFKFGKHKILENNQSLYLNSNAYNYASQFKCLLSKFALKRVVISSNLVEMEIRNEDISPVDLIECILFLNLDD